jgi:hypothetical protein
VSNSGTKTDENNIEGQADDAAKAIEFYRGDDDNTEGALIGLLTGIKHFCDRASKENPRLNFKRIMQLADLHYRIETGTERPTRRSQGKKSMSHLKPA